MTEQEILNQLNDVDLSKVETSFPLLKSGIVPVVINKCELRRDVEKKGDDAKPYYYIEYALQQPWATAAVDGAPSKPVNPGERGSTFNERVYIGTYEDKNTHETKWYGVDRIAKLYEAVFSRKAPEGTKIPQVAIEVIGQTVLVNLLFEPQPRNKDTGEVYGPRTSVHGYVRKPVNK